MKSIRTSLFICCVFAICCGQPARAQSTGQPEILQVERALELALQNNLSLKTANLDVAKVDEQLAALRTRRLPEFHLDTWVSKQAIPIKFVFDRGVFGDYPLVGPIPGKNTVISTPDQFTSVVIGRVTQPLSQLYQVHLRLSQLELNRELAQERLRMQQHELARKLKQVYFSIVQTQGALDSARENVKVFHELDRVTDQYIQQNVALTQDSLNLKVRMAKAEYEVLQFEDQLAMQKRQLNQLMGRDLLMDFAVSISPIENTTMDPDTARAEALQNRPELREARLKIEQASGDRRLKKSEFIPQAALDFQYYSLQNFESFLPRNVAAFSFVLNWEVFDWGRKRHELNERDMVIEQTRNQLHDAETSVLLDVDDKYRKLQQSRQLLRIAELSQQALREGVRVVTDRYRTEVSLVKDVLQAQAELEQSNSQYKQALSSVWAAQVEFWKATGTD